MSVNVSMSVLNTLFESYKNNPNEENLNKLLAEVRLYSQRVVTKTGGVLGRQLNQQGEISSAATIKIWQSISKFAGDSKFSSWAYRVVRNVLLDTIRKHHSLAEVEFKEEAAYGEYCGSRGASSESENGEFETRGGAKAPLANVYGQDDEALVDELYSLIEELSGEDWAIIQWYLDGVKPAEMGRRLGQNAKWASNQLTRIKKNLKRLAKSGGSPVILTERKKSITLPASQAAD